MTNKDKNLIKSGMPESVISEVIAEQTRITINDAISDLHYSVIDLRNAGVPIETVDDLEGITANSIKAQLAKDKEAYFKNMRFVPTGIRKQVNREFAEMEKTLIPLVNRLFNDRKRVPISYTLNIKENYKTMESCIKYDTKELEDYIKKAATIQIAPEFREYYESLSDFCKAFAKLQNDAKRLHIVEPNRSLVLDLMDIREDFAGEINPSVSGMTITPKKMFGLINSNRIRKENEESN